MSLIYWLALGAVALGALGMAARAITPQRPLLVRAGLVLSRV